MSVEPSEAQIEAGLRAYMEHLHSSNRTATVTAVIKAAMKALDPDFTRASPQDEVERVARQAIINANNSLYGSQGFFLSTNGGDPDEYHLARPIEALKARANEQWRRAEKAEAALTAMSPSQPAHSEQGEVDTMWDALCRFGLVTKDGTWLQCGKNAFAEALAALRYSPPTNDGEMK